MDYLKPEQEYAVFIGGLPKLVKRETIYNILKKICYVKKLDLPSGHGSGKQNKGHAFLHVRSQEEVDKLLNRKTIKIRNTECDIMPYKKNGKRLIEEMSSACISRDFDSGRVSAVYPKSPGELAPEDPSADFVNIQNEQIVNVVRDMTAHRGSMSDASATSRDSCQSRNVNYPVNLTVPEVQIIAENDLIHSDYFIGYGLEEENARIIAEYINNCIIQKVTTKEYFGQHFPAMLEFHKNQIETAILEQVVSQSVGSHVNGYVSGHVGFTPQVQMTSFGEYQNGY